MLQYASKESKEFELERFFGAEAAGGEGGVGEACELEVGRAEEEE